MYQSFTNILIEGVSTCVPEKVIINTDFPELNLSPKDIKLFEKTVGIKERRWAEDDVTASDLGYKAITDLFAQERFNKEDIECLIFVSQTPDYKIPFTSNILQSRLKLKRNILCIDVNAGCAGFIQGLSLAYSIANSLNGGKVLLVIAETLSKILCKRDKGTTMLFGDAASALIISSSIDIRSDSYFNFFSDGDNYDAIKIPNGGYRNLIDDLTTIDLNLQMDGSRVFDFTLREIANSILDLINYYSIEKSAIDFYMFHQSNKFIIEQIAHKLDIPKHKVPINIGSFGNTSGVSLPLLITTSKTEFMSNTKQIVFSGYGSGLNWGNCMLQLRDTTYIGDLITY